MDHGPGRDFDWQDSAHHAHDDWWGGPLHLIFFILFLALLVAGAVLLVRRLHPVSRGSRSGRGRSTRIPGSRSCGRNPADALRERRGLPRGLPARDGGSDRRRGCVDTMAGQRAGRGHGTDGRLSGPDAGPNRPWFQARAARRAIHRGAEIRYSGPLATGQGPSRVYRHGIQTRRGRGRRSRERSRSSRVPSRQPRSAFRWLPSRSAAFFFSSSWPSLPPIDRGVGRRGASLQHPDRVRHGCGCPVDRDDLLLPRKLSDHRALPGLP